MPSGGRPTVPGPWSSRVVHVPGPGLGRAVALEDRDAEVLPGALEGRRQERAGREEQAEVAAELARGRSGRGAAGARTAGAGRSRRRRSKARRRPRLVDLALDGAPEQVEDLGDDDHAGHPVVAQGIEDDPRVPAAHVQDVGADVERVVQPDRLLEQVRERQQRDDAGAPSAG